MATNWRIVRVFLSSTFLDMQAERDWLVRFVFPRLRKELLQRRIHLVDVDLRWGVTSDQDALAVCREIIDECRPRFLCVLGGRYGWVPPGRNQSITADEVRYGVLDRMSGSSGFAYFYFRDGAATDAMKETVVGEFREPEGTENQTRLIELKRAIVDAGFEPFVYSAEWHRTSRRLVGLKAFGDRVYDDLLSSVRSDADLRDHFANGASAALDEYDEEHGAIEAFVEERSERLVLGSREPVLASLLGYAGGTDGNGYLCLTGPSGSGKSALLARFCRQFPSTVHPSTVFIPHFVGASHDSSDVRRTLRRFCHELKAACPDITAEIPDQPDELRAALSSWLRQACAHQSVVLLIDALDQFDESQGLSGITWLPDELPPGARIVLSALDGPALEALRRRTSRPSEIELPPLAPSDGQLIIERFAERYRKRLDADQCAMLLAKADAGTPLYLLVALDELRTLGTFDQMARRIVELPPTTQQLFAWILERLEDDGGFCDVAGLPIGRQLVSHFGGLLSVSRHGLSENELTELLQPADPLGNVAALLQLVRPYLMRRGESLDFYHGAFRQAVWNRYLTNPQQQEAAHAELAALFHRRAHGPSDHLWSGGRLRDYEEMPYHQTMGGMVRQAFDTLTDLRYLERSCHLEQAATIAIPPTADAATYRLLADMKRLENVLRRADLDITAQSCDNSAAAAPSGSAAAILAQYYRALQACRSHVAVWPASTFAEFHNRLEVPLGGLRAGAELLAQARKRHDRPWFRTTDQAFAPEVPDVLGEQALAAPRGGEDAFDRKLLIASSARLAIAIYGDHRRVVMMSLPELNIVETPLRHAPKGRFYGVDPSGQHLFAVGDDGSLARASILDGRQETLLDANGPPVKAVRFAWESAELAWLREDGRLTFLSLSTLEERMPFESPPGAPPILHFDVSPDGRRLVLVVATDDIVYIVDGEQQAGSHLDRDKVPNDVSCVGLHPSEPIALVATSLPGSIPRPFYLKIDFTTLTVFNWRFETPSLIDEPMHFAASPGSVLLHDFSRLRLVDAQGQVVWSRASSKTKLAAAYDSALDVVVILAVGGAQCLAVGSASNNRGSGGQPAQSVQLLRNAIRLKGSLLTGAGYLERGRQIVTANSNGVTFFDAQTAEISRSIPIGDAIDSDEGRLFFGLAAGDDTGVIVYLTEGSLSFLCSPRDPYVSRLPLFGKRLEGDTATVNSRLAASRDCLRVAALNDFGRLWCIDLATGQSSDLQVPKDTATCLTPDGEYVLLAHDDSESIDVRRFHGLQAVRSIPRPVGSVVSCAVGPEGRHVYVAAGGAISCTDIKTGRQAWSTPAKAGRLSISPDGSLVYAVGEVLTAYATADGRQLALLPLDDAWAFSSGPVVCRDGREILVGLTSGALLRMQLENYEPASPTGAASAVPAADARAPAFGFWKHPGNKAWHLYNLGLWAQMHVRDGEIDDAFELMGQQEAICREVADFGALTRCLASQAGLHRDTGDLGAASTAWQQAVDSARWAGDSVWLVACLNDHALMQMNSGDLDRAMALFKEQEQACLDSDDRKWLHYCLGNQALILTKEGREREAIPLFDRQEAICQESHQIDSLQRCLNNRALARCQIGDFAKAMADLREAEQRCTTAHHMEGLAYSLMNQAVVLGRDLLDPDRAMPIAERALTIATEHGVESVVSQIGEVIERLRATPTSSATAGSAPGFSISNPHPDADPERATQLNLAYQRQLKAWQSLSWWTRVRTRKPEPPRGI